MLDGDAEAVSRLLGASWRRTYGSILGDDIVERITGEYHAPPRLRVELADSQRTSLVAERPDGSIAGYANTEPDASGDVTLDRLHIEKSEFGTGLAARMLVAICAAHAGAPGIRLEVIDGNDRAMAFYRKHGFAVISHGPSSHEGLGISSILRKPLRGA